MAHPSSEDLHVDKVRDLIRAVCEPLGRQRTREKIALETSLGRILAEDILSPIDIPSANNSAMDGYAFNGSVLSGHETISLEVAHTIFAGHTEKCVIASGTCARIMTGAPLPDGCDTVIPQELVKVDDQFIRFQRDLVRRGDNVRLRGEELSTGQLALAQGQMLSPAHLGLLAGLGIAQVSVYQKVSVGFFSTGSELRSLGETLDSGSAYDSNRYTLMGMLTRLGVQTHDFGIVRDDPKALREVFHKALKTCDVIITSGGVSVGQADYTKQIMQEFGSIDFWKVAMRPGRPMAFGHLKAAEDEALLFGLPGNPVAVMVTFYQFVQEALHLLGGGQSLEPLLVNAVLAEPIRKRAGRTEYQRGICQRLANGQLEVRTTGSQGSGMLSSMVAANCLIVLDHEQESLNVGDTVPVQLFNGLI